MVRIDDPATLHQRFPSASEEALAAFGDGRLYAERFVERARHVEVQILGDAHGTVIHLGDRDCSVQRRFQKVIEEAPAVGLADELREGLAAAAVALGRELGYCGAGTVEFLVDLDREDFSFLEVNTRLQVEHPVTEAVTGVDIVREQLRLAAGRPLSVRQQDVAVTGHAIECRINAEAPDRDFLPSPGTITTWEPPHGDAVRIDSHAFAGYDVPPFYDSLIAKLIVAGTDRAGAIRATQTALANFTVEGVDTTIDLHRSIIGHPDFERGDVTTIWLEQVLLDRALQI